MKRHWKKIVIAVAALVLVVLGGSFIYAKVLNQADAEFDQGDVDELLGTTSVASTAPGSSPDTTAAAAGSSTTQAATTPTGIDGTWVIAAGSEVGYRVNESINGFDTTANGRTNAITGQFVIAGTSVESGDWSVDMTTFKSDENRRDNQFKGRIMAVDQFPTSTFVLTAPIDLGSVPADGTTITASATGDLTLHGTTNPVTFDVEATFRNGRIGVLGQIPVVFADYGIPNPSIATIKTEDHGLLEFVLVFDLQP